MFIYKKKNHHIQICRCVKHSLTEAKKKKKKYANKQHGEHDSKGNRCENTCIFPNSEYNQTMDNGEYQEL